MFKPKKIQKSSFYVTDENGLVTIKESPTFILSCGKVGYWAASDYIEEKKGDFLVTLMYATPENSKCIYGTINVDDMRGKDLYDQWQSYLDWQKKELRKIQR